MNLPYTLVNNTQDFSPKQLLTRPPALRFIIFSLGFTEAVLNLFAGPLFANLIAYDLLDCAIWGISPAIFFIVQPKLKQFITTGDNCYRRRMLVMTLAAIFLPIGYAALNYSQKFMWNYLTRLVNLDVGYIVLDFSMKVIIYVFDVQADQQKVTQQARSLQVVNFHKLTFVAELVCYSLAFYVCMYGRKGRQYYQYSLFITSLIGCGLIIPIPIIYFFQHKISLSYSFMQCPEDQSKVSDLEEQFQNSAKLQIAGYFLLKCSLYVNLAYSTLWIMTNFLTLKIPQNRAFIESVKIGSFYYIISSILSFIFGFLFKIFSSYLKIIISIFHFIFGILLIYCWSKFTLQGFGVCIIFSGIQLALVNHYQRITPFQHLINKIALIAQIISFCVIPVLITLITQIDEAVVFVMLSGAACLFSSISFIFAACQ